MLLCSALGSKHFSYSESILHEIVMSIRLLALILIGSILIVNPQYLQTDTPEFLEVGSFAQYKQEFSTGETHELYWEIVSLEHSNIEIQVRSHGLIFNTTTETFATISGGGTLVADKNSLVILYAYHPNGTEITDYPVGEKAAFWISPETNESTPIDTMYETNEFPLSVGPLEFDCLPTPRMCWMTENEYSFGNQMNRYYDQQTGIVLKIETNRTVSSVDISILETLNDTNIVPLIEVVNGINLEIVVLCSSIVGFILIVIILYLRKSAR